MELDVKQLIEIREQAMSQFLRDGISPDDICFYLLNGEFGSAMLPLQGDFPPSFKYNARKQVLASLVNGTLSPQLKNASRIIYFSYDDVYGVDYCFDINMRSKEITLYIVKKGNIVRRYKNFDIQYDERNDIAQL